MKPFCSVAIKNLGNEGEIEDLANSLLTVMNSLVFAVCSAVAVIVLLLFGKSNMGIS